MNTRSTLNLTDTPINDLLSTCTKRTEESEPPTNHGLESVITDPSSAKQETTSAPIEDHPSSVSRSPPTMSDAEDILDLQEVQHKRSELEKRFLQKIPVFKPTEDTDVNEFVSSAETIFTHLQNSDETRLAQKGNATWKGFKRELPRQLNPQSSAGHPTIDPKPCSISFNLSKDCDNGSSALDQVRGQVTSFSGDGSARQWFILFDSQLSETNLSLTDRFEILPYFLTGEAMLWFSFNKHKMQCYTDFCREFAIEYLQPNRAFGRITFVDRKNDLQSLQSSLPINVSTSVIPLHSPNKKAPDVLCRDVSSSDTASIISSSSVLSPATSNALIDKFVKDPIKFSGGKDKVTTWIDEVDQQSTTMHLNELRSSLSTETQRNHLKTTAEFLEQAKRAEEIPGVQFDPGVELIDRRRAATTDRLINCRISASSTSDH